MSLIKLLTRIYHNKSSIHLFLAPIRHKLTAFSNFTLPNHVYQARGTTERNRRPQLFRAIQEIITDETNTKLLSFGCSTGEEVADLLFYLKKTHIYGTDINRQRLNKAKTLVNNTRVKFFRSSPENLKENGPFDMILACSVFIRHPEDTHTNDLNRIYPFSAFEQGIRLLVENLKFRGLLVIQNANYRVLDTDIAGSLKCLQHPNVIQSSNIPLFDKNGHRLPSSKYNEQIFQLEKQIAY